MPLQDFFRRNLRESAFANWPSYVECPAFIRSGRILHEFVQSPGQYNKTPKALYPPTIIIALGKTGHAFLNALIEKVKRVEDEWPSSLRALLLTTSPLRLNSHSVHVDVQELRRQETLPLPAGGLHWKRQYPKALFQQAFNYKTYQEWLQSNLLELEQNVQCFVVGSFGDQDFGMVEGALQILRQMPLSIGRSNLLSRITLLLAPMSDDGSAISEEEMFAALREIGRTTFAGRHKMGSFRGASSVVDMPLCDHLFLVDTRFSGEDVYPKKPMGAQILAESVFALLHPSSSFLWGNLMSDSRSAGNLRAEHHQAFVHSLAIASVYMPAKEIKSYVAARLAFALLFGEHPEQRDGLLQELSTHLSVERFGARLLLDGPVQHPFFDWFLHVRGVADLSNLPRLQEDFHAVIRAQVSHSLVNALNRQEIDLSHARKSLEWLEACFKERLTWLEQSRLPSIERACFQEILDKACRSIHALIVNISEWEKACSHLLPGTNKQLPRKGGWREQDSVSNSTEGAQEKQEVGLRTVLEKRLKSEQASVLHISQGGITRSVILPSARETLADGLNLLENYYTRTVRPELSRSGISTSEFFSRLQRQLEWWCEWGPGREPQLYLLCWPLQKNPAPIPPNEIRFGVNNLSALAEAIYNLCLSYTPVLDNDLTNWFREREPLFIGFLQRARDVYLEYDHNDAVAFPDAALRRSYLISSDAILSREIINDVFPDTPRSQVNELTDGPQLSLTALTLRLNIPISSVLICRQWYQEYQIKAEEGIHLCDPERNAVRYEKRWWKLQRSRALITPDIVLLLTDAQLVTTFFQAVFCGLIVSQQENDSDQEIWTMQGVEGFPPLPLAPAGKDGLILALRRFVLELSNDPTAAQNPNNPFHPDSRDNYLGSLKRRIKEILQNPAKRALCDAIKHRELAYWERRAEKDTFAHSFYVLLFCEADEPVAPNW